MGLGDGVAMEIEIDLKLMEKKKKKKSGIDKRSKVLRRYEHAVSLLCLVSLCRERNSLCDDPELQGRLLSLLPLPFWKEEEDSSFSSSSKGGGGRIHIIDLSEEEDDVDDTAASSSGARKGKGKATTVTKAAGDKKGKGKGKGKEPLVDHSVDVGEGFVRKLLNWWFEATSYTEKMDLEAHPYNLEKELTKRDIMHGQTRVRWFEIHLIFNIPLLLSLV